MSSLQPNRHTVKSQPRKLGLNIAAAMIPALLLVAALGSNGCGVYRNLTTYFNTYYNAQHLFEDAVNEMKKSPQKDRDTNYFARWVVPPATQGKFDSVIAKCSKVIQFHAQSGYMDDALLMIGQAYAYQNDAESAIRKFKELITTFPGSDLGYQARLWEAKTLYFDKKYDEAITVANLAAQEAEAHDERAVLIEALMLQAQVAMDKKEFDLAAGLYEKAVQPRDADELRTIAAFQMGAVYDSLGKPEKAAKAYKSVRQYGPDMVTRFRADYKYGVMLEQTGEYTIALKLFDDLKYDAPKPEDKGLLDLELAKTYTLMDDTARAFEFYGYIDSTYRNQIASEKSYYERGKLFETRYNDLKMATGYYKLAQTTSFNTPEGNRARQKYTVFSHYFSVLNNLAMYDSLLHPERYKRAIDSTDSLHLRVADSLALASADSGKAKTDGSALAVNVASRNVDSSAVPSPPAGGLGRFKLPPQGQAGNQPQGDSVKSGQGRLSPGQTSVNNSGVNAPPGSPLTGLFPQRQPSGQPRPGGNLMPPPNVPAPGERAEPPPMFQAALGGDNDDEDVDRDRVQGRGISNDHQVRKNRPGVATAGVADSLFGKSSPVGKSAMSRPMVTLSPDTIKKLICRSKFELAGVFYLELNMPDSAAFLYQQIIEDSTETPLRPAAMYALSEIRRSRGDSLRADSLNNIVVQRYPKTEYGKKIKYTRGMDTASAPDPRWVRYRTALDSLQSGNYKETLQLLVSLYADTSDTSAVAAKSLYTSGWVLENLLVKNDSAAALYKQLVHRFPTSAFALVAQPKVAVKDDPKSLSQFVKVKEISAVAKPVKTHGKQAGKEGLKSGQTVEEQDEPERDEELLRSRSGDRDVNDDATDETDTTDDESDNN